MPEPEAMIMKTTFNIGEDSQNGEFDESYKKTRSIPSYYLIVLIIYLTLLSLLTSLIDDRLPTPLSSDDAGPNKFSEERAWAHLVQLVGHGPRVAGTQYHLEKTKDLYNVLKDIAANATRKVHTDWQIVSGDYWLGYASPYVNMYNNVTNLVAVVAGGSGFNSDGTTNTSLLFNCHYDSVPTSPGASDNAMFCATMLEILTIISKRNETFQHNIIFLFNGAEENPLQGSAGFLKHPWSKGVTALVNLDAAGTNCKGLVFQVTDTRVLKAYKQAVTSPSGQAFGEVLFSSGLVPSDTDFRIFRDFADIYGIDIALYKQGNVYHTKHDAISTIKPGVVQHAGNTLLSMIELMGDDKEFSEKGTKSSAVYWDYLNLIMFVYDRWTAFIVDTLIVLVALSSILYHHRIIGLRPSITRHLLLSVINRLICILSGCVTVVLFNIVPTYTYLQLRYLSRHWIVIPMYWIPFAIGAVTASHLLDYYRGNKCGLNRIRRMAQLQCATRLILTLIAVAMIICVDATARYVITVPLLIISLTSIITSYVIRTCKVVSYQLIISQLILTTPALLMYFMIANKTNGLMLPIMGRSPISKPDITVGVLNVALVLLICLPLSGIELLFSRSNIKKVLLALSLSCIIVCFIPFSPYGNENLVVQRHYWFHSEIITYDINGQQIDKQTGIWISRIDANLHTAEPFLSKAFNKDINTTFDENRFCGKFTYCNLPVVTPRTFGMKNSSIWIDFEPPNKSKPETKLSLINKKWNENNLTMDFSVTGTPHMSIIIRPQININLTKWSLSAPIAYTTEVDRKIYFIYVTQATSGLDLKPIQFSITLEVPESSNKENIIDISLNAHRISHPEENTESYTKLLKQMPDYFNVASYLSTRYNYIF